MSKQQTQSRYEEAVSAAFDEIYQESRQNDTLSFNLMNDRCIIFSDHHRGARNRADDFRFAERAYNAALAYYFRLGHTLIILGDAEELWEERPASVLKSYEHTFALEAQYHQAGRYMRFWGNHDNDWNIESMVKLYLDPVYGGAPLKVRESLLLSVTDGESVLGQIFLAHGHQGTTASDRYAPISRFFVRHFWRVVQRITGRSLNTPASNWELRERHNIALYRWANRQQKLVLIAGHTHRPVFESRSHPDQILTKIENLEKELAANPNDAELLEKISLLAAELEWVRAQENEQHGAEGNIIMKNPCYFNTGCCSFSDGDITGLEIVNGEIRLIRFPNQNDRPEPQILEYKSLKNILARS